MDEQLQSRNLQGAWQLVKDTHTYCIESAVVAAGLIALRNGAQASSEAMQSVKARMRPALDANLSILATIGSNAPFVGLLGTVLGIINAAHELTGGGGQNNPNAVMSGVFEALVATAVGLFVAIPAVVAYNLFQRRVRKRLAAVDSLAHLILSTARTEARPAASPASELTNEGRVMAGHFSSGYADEDDGALSDINVTPLVDVTLVLLIVFMITVPAIVGSARVKVDLPETTAVAAESEQPSLAFVLKRNSIGSIRAVSERKPDRRSQRAQIVRGWGPAEQRSASVAIGGPRNRVRRGHTRRGYVRVAGAEKALIGYAAR